MRKPTQSKLTALVVLHNRCRADDEADRCSSNRLADIIVGILSVAGSSTRYGGLAGGVFSLLSQHETEERRH
jgi:hypothetical protein